MEKRERMEQLALDFQYMDLATAITLLKTMVKGSHLDNQKHIDLSLCMAEDRPKYQYALMLAQNAVAKGEISQDELKRQLGLS